MRVSKSRNVCGYVKRVQRATAIQARIAEADAKHAARTRPLRRQLDQLQVEIAEVFGRMNGSQIAEARRLTTAAP